MLKNKNEQAIEDLVIGDYVYIDNKTIGEIVNKASKVVNVSVDHTIHMITVRDQEGREITRPYMAQDRVATHTSFLKRLSRWYHGKNPKN